MLKKSYPMRKKTAAKRPLVASAFGKNPPQVTPGQRGWGPLFSRLVATGRPTTAGGRTPMKTSALRRIAGSVVGGPLVATAFGKKPPRMKGGTPTPPGGTMGGTVRQRAGQSARAQASRRAQATTSPAKSSGSMRQRAGQSARAQASKRATAAKRKQQQRRVNAYGRGR